MTDAIDLGLFDHTVWRLANFLPRFNYIKQMDLWGDHTHFILALMALFYWIWEDPRMLLLIQALVTTAGVFPIFWLAKEKFSEISSQYKKSENTDYPLPIYFASYAIAFAYLSFIGLQTAIEYDFHEIALAAGILCWTFYFLLTKKKSFWLEFGYWLSLLLALSCKEDVPLFAIIIGLYTIIFLKKYKKGLLTLFLGIGLYYFLVYKFIPMLKGGTFAYEHLDTRLGKTSFDLIKTCLTNPFLVLKVLFTPSIKFKTMTNLAGNFAFYPLFTPFTAIITPALAERFLTFLSQRWLIKFQYSVIFDPIFAVGAILGMLNIIKILRFLKRTFAKQIENTKRIKIIGPLSEWWTEPRFFNFLAAVLIFMSLFVVYRTNTPLFRMFNPKYYQDQKRFELNRKMLTMVPDNPHVSVQAQSAFVPHLSHRFKINRYPDWSEKNNPPHFIIMSADEHSDPVYDHQKLKEIIVQLKKDQRYEVMYDDETRILLKLKKNYYN